MEEDFSDSVPCSSLAVDSVLRMGSVSPRNPTYPLATILHSSQIAGAIWGSCFGPFDAKRRGLSGSARALFIGKSVGQYGFSCGLFAAIFSFTHCGIQRYRRRKDWVNTFAAGVVAGAAFGAGTRNWKQVAGVTGLFCTFFQFAKDSKSV